MLVYIAQNEPVTLKLNYVLKEKGTFWKPHLSLGFSRKECFIGACTCLSHLNLSFLLGKMLSSR